MTTMENLCVSCQHEFAKHSKIDDREWCVFPCKCIHFTTQQEVDAAFAPQPKGGISRFVVGNTDWEDEGDKEWTRRQDDSAKRR